MAILVSAPGRDDLRIEHLLLDVNGTLTDRGHVLPGVETRIAELRTLVGIRLLSADTFGTLGDVAQQLGGLPVVRVARGADKAALARQVGATRCAAIGNGANDEVMLATVSLGVAVLGREGASPRAVSAADVVTATILDALDLLLDPTVLAATLRT